LAKDRKPDDAPAARGETRGGSSRSTAAGSRPAGGKTATGGRSASGGRSGRTRPPTQVVTAQRKPWGLIAGALAVVVFAAAVISYAVVQVNKANAGKATSPDDIAGLQTYTYAAGQEHVQAPVPYTESPPVGGPHDPYWADCTGTVYTVDIRHENAVHALEHGAVWITYNPDKLSQPDIDKLAALVTGTSNRLMSPYAGLDSPISVQSWNHQLKVSSADDKRIKQFADFFTANAKYYPEVGASCQNTDFRNNPIVTGQQSTPIGRSDATTAPTAASASTAP
jgi:hypothetical protein